MTLAVIVGGSPLQEHLGQPELVWQLGWLHAGGLREATLCLSEGAAAVRGRFGDGGEFGIKLRYHVQGAPLGTAGAVKALGAASLPDDVLVVSGRPEQPLGGIVAAHRGSGRAATLAVHACAHEPACRPAVVGPEDRLVDFPPAPLVGRFPLGVSSFWVVSRRLLQLVPEGKPCDFLRDVFPAALKSGEALGAWRVPAAKAARHPKESPLG